MTHPYTVAAVQWRCERGNPRKGEREGEREGGRKRERERV